MKIANKREQSQTCLSFAEREQFAGVSRKNTIKRAQSQACLGLSSMSNLRETKKVLIFLILLMMGIHDTVWGQPFDITVSGSETSTQIHLARNSITFAAGYTYTPNGGTMTAEIQNPVVDGGVTYNYTIIDPENRSLNTSYLVGATQGAFNVSLLGGATYTIPIEAPPGVAGLRPDLSLTYNSLGGPGVAGYGWSISGISVITRSPQTYYHDGAATGIELATTDRFSLDGQRVVCTSGYYGGNGSQYRTEYDIFTRVTCYSGTDGPTQFFAEAKNGLDYQYGYTSDADQTVSGYNQILNWYVNRITDQYGNQINYQYVRDNGLVYLGEITYGPNAITFYYKQRSDITSSYLKGSRMSQNLILDRIEVKYNSNVIKKYEMKYNYPSSNYNRYSILNEVIEYGIGSSRLNSTAFSYQAPDNVAFSQAIYNTSHNYISYKSKIYTGDFNGDGREDIFTIDNPDIDGSYTGWKLNINSGNDYFSLYSGSFSLADETKIVDITPMDINGDGKDDLILAIADDVNFPNGWQIPYVEFFYAISSGTSVSSAQFIAFKWDAKALVDPLLSPDKRGGDFDGDGVGDCCIINGSGVVDIYSFSNSSGQLGSFSLKYTQDLGTFDDSDKIFVSDFNGDGKTDIWVSNADGLKIYSLTGTSFSVIYTTSIPKRDHYFRVGDFNGDGKTDLFVYGYTTYDWSDWQMRLSTGTGFEINYIPKKKSNLKNDLVRVGDFNGDGCSDLMVMATNDAWSGHYYYISKAQGADFYSQFYSGAQYSTHNYYIGDFSGSGRDDYLCTDGREAWWNGYMIYRSGTKNRIWMEKFANGLNAFSRISYTYLSKAGSSVYTKGAGATFPVFDYQGRLPVVSSLLTDNGLGSQNTINYAYQGAKIHRQGKGFLNYAKQTITDVANSTSTENYYEYNSSYYFPILRYVYNKAGSTTIASVTNSSSYLTTITGVNNFNVVFPYIVGSSKTNNLTGHIVNQTALYDTYGNPTQQARSFDNGVTETTVNVYDNNTTNWWLGRLTSSSMRYARYGEDLITHNTSMTYSSDGILKPDLIKYLEGTSSYYYKDHNYNSNGNLVQLTESGTGGVGSRQTGYTYEANGIRLGTTTDPLGHVTTNNYDTYGRLSSQIDYLNNTTSYTYDNLGRITTKTRPDGFVGTTAYTWGLSGGPTNSCYYVQQSGNDGSLSKAWHDELARGIRSDVKSFEGSQIYTVSEYDNKGQLHRVSEPSASISPSQWNTYTYDTYGRIDYIDRPSGRDTDYEYSNKRVTETTGGKARWKETDSQGLITSAGDDGGNITYSYYTDGKVKTITAPGNIITSMQYDLAGNQIQLADPSAGTINYTYDAFGQMDTMINARNQTTVYHYYADGRLNTRTAPEGTTTYGYDATTKQLTGITSPGSVSRSYGYDTKGRVQTISETIPGSSSAFMTTFTYDSYGRLSTRTHPSGIVETMNYNANGYLASISAGGVTRWTVTTMNARQQITAATLGSALNATFGFDDYGYPTSSKATYNSVYKQDYRYSFNPVTGNLNSRQNYLDSLLIESFTYDDLDRLREVSGPQNLSMTYGTNGNINTKSDIGTTAFTYGEDAGPYALTGVTSSTSAIPVAPQAASYTSFDQVSTINEGNYQATFAYNSDDQRAKMTVTQSGATIMSRWYTGSRYMKETAGSTTKEYTWVGGDAYSAPVVAVKEGSTTTWYYLLRDYLGNITHQVDASGNVIAEYNFDPWGRRRDKDTWSYTLDSEPVLFADRGFTGHEHLTWFNLVNMNGRLYDPLVGRFLSPDTYVQMPDFTQNFNRYSYALNNPLVYTDQDGESLLLLAAIIGGWMGMGQAMISSDKEGWGLVGDMFKGLFVGAASGVAGAWAGGAMAGTMGYSTTFGGAVVHGAMTGVAGGFAGGFTAGAGGAWLSGAGFEEGLSAGITGGMYGGAIGGVIGGISGGIQYQKQISAFQKGNAILGIENGNPVPATDQFLSSSQKVWYKDAPMDKVRAFTVENVPESHLTGRNGLITNKAPAKTVPFSVNKGIDRILSGYSNVYFNKALAFSSAKQLFFAMGHEFIHVSQFAALAGQSASILTPDFITMLEFHAYSYQNSLGGVQFNSFTRDEIIRWSTAYPQFNSMGYLNFPWTFNHSFVYPF